MSEDKKLIYFLVTIIIVFAIVLLIKMKATSQYDPKVYSDIYNEYENIFSQEDGFYKIDESNIQNTIDNNVIKNENNSYTTVAGTTARDMENSKVIGKIIIPKIGIRYPNIKETTTEYL